MLQGKSTLSPFAYRKQRGQVFLVAMLIMLVGGASVFYGFSTFNQTILKADQTTATALAQGKEALIGYAAAHTTRPGTLPCPDVNNDGETDNNCNSAVLRIGRLPWKSLGLPDLRDGSGERLWYAVSNVFKNSPITGYVNSDISGEFTVNGVTGVIAVIFSPGTITGSQHRDAANINNVANYLDGGNEVGGTSFTTGTTTNDKLLLITKDNLFPSVEKRVIRDVGRTLQLHYNNPSGSPLSDNTNHRYYPYPAPFSGSTACDTTTPIYRGRIALSCSSPLSVMTPPMWFVSNRWNEVLVYSVAPKCTPRIITGGPDFAAIPEIGFPPSISKPGKNCINFLPLFFICFPNTVVVDSTSLDCNNTGTFLTVSGVSTSAEALLFSAGPGLGSQTRPNCPSANHCLEDSQNTEMPDNYTYVRPQKSPNNNDSLFIVGPPGL